MVRFEIETGSNIAETVIQEEISTVIEDLFQRDKPTLDVIITPNFETAVKRFVPYETGVEYKANHGYGIARAKTIPRPANGRLRFVVIFDAVVFRDMSKTPFPNRWATIVHELIHVKIDLLRFRATGQEAFFALPNSKMEIARHNANGLWEEYAIERYVAELIAGAVRKTLEPRGNEVVQFPETVQFCDDLVRDLQSYEEVLRESVRRFLTPGTDLTSLTRAATGTIVGILLRMAKVYAVGEVSESVRNKILEIEGNVAFRRYFANSWNHILSLMREYYSNRSVYRSDIIDVIANEYNNLVEKSGIEIEDDPAGFRVRMRMI